MLAVWKFMEVKTIQMKIGWNVQCVFNGPWVVLPFIDCMQIKLSDGFQQFYFIFFFFEPCNFMGRTTWVCQAFCQDITRRSRRKTIEPSLKELCTLKNVNVQWQKVYYSSAEKIYQTDGFFKKPFLSKTDFKTNYDFKIRVWFCWMNPLRVF